MGREAWGGAPGLYLHVPFCSAICPYCDFSVLKAGAPTRQRFVARLLDEVALAAPCWLDPRPFDTLYFGGGTPSLLPPEELERVVGACRRRLSVDPEARISIEANPEDVTPERCAAWRQLGVRTLSLGVQSFSDQGLRFLGRRHSAQEGRAAVVTALTAGFATVSVDLIFGLPGQSPEAWRADLRAAVELEPGHLSCYQLTVHPRTRFGVAARRGQLDELPDEQQAALFELTHGFLAEAGWPAYEVSNFAHGPEHQSRHNRKYWDHTPYLGLGPSAHSFAPPEAGRAARRWWNELRLPRWEQRLEAGERPVDGEEPLDREALATEALMLGLRTTEGIALAEFARRHGVDLLASNETLVARLIAEGRLRLSGAADQERRLQPTRAGLAVADGLGAAFDVGPSATRPRG